MFLIDYAKDWLKKKGRWVWVLAVLLLFFGGVMFGKSWGGRGKDSMKAELVKGYLEDIGAQEAKYVKEISSISAEYLANEEANNAAHQDTIDRYEALLADGDAKIVAQTRAKTKWMRTAGATRDTLDRCEQIKSDLASDATTADMDTDLALGEMRRRLDDCESRTQPELAVADMQPCLVQPCSAEDMAVRVGCDMETIEVAADGSHMAVGYGSADVRTLGWEKTFGPERFNDLEFSMVRPRDKKWGWWSHLGIAKKLDSVLYDGLAGTNSPEYLFLDQSQYGLAFGGTLHRTKHGLTATATVNSDGFDSVQAMWSFRGIPFVGN